MSDWLHAFIIYHPVQTQNWSWSSFTAPPGIRPGSPPVPKVQLNDANRDGSKCFLSRDWFCDKRRRLVWQTGRRGAVHNVALSPVQRLTKMLSSPGCVSILVRWWKVTGQDIWEWHVTFLKEQPHHSGAFEPFAAAVAPGGASSTGTLTAKRMVRSLYIQSDASCTFMWISGNTNSMWSLLKEGSRAKSLLDTAEWGIKTAADRDSTRKDGCNIS